jgi:hypothetical protein
LEEALEPELRSPSAAVAAAAAAAAAAPPRQSKEEVSAMVDRLSARRRGSSNTSRRRRAGGCAGAAAENKGATQPPQVRAKPAMTGPPRLASPFVVATQRASIGLGARKDAATGTPLPLAQDEVVLSRWGASSLHVLLREAEASGDEEEQGAAAAEAEAQAPLQEGSGVRGSSQHMCAVRMRRFADCGIYTAEQLAHCLATKATTSAQVPSECWVRGKPRLLSELLLSCSADCTPSQPGESGRQLTVWSQLMMRQLPPMVAGGAAYPSPPQPDTASTGTALCPGGAAVVRRGGGGGGATECERAVLSPALKQALLTLPQLAPSARRWMSCLRDVELLDGEAVLAAIGDTAGLRGGRRSMLDVELNRRLRAVGARCLTPDTMLALADKLQLQQQRQHEAAAAAAAAAGAGAVSAGGGGREAAAAQGGGRLHARVAAAPPHLLLRGRDWAIYPCSTLLGGAGGVLQKLCGVMTGPAAAARPQRQQPPAVSSSSGGGGGGGSSRPAPADTHHVVWVRGAMPLVLALQLPPGGGGADQPTGRSSAAAAQRQRQRQRQLLGLVEAMCARWLTCLGVVPHVVICCLPPAGPEAGPRCSEPLPEASQSSRGRGGLPPASIDAWINYHTLIAVAQAEAAGAAERPNGGWQGGLLVELLLHASEGEEEGEVAGAVGAAPPSSLAAAGAAGAGAGAQLELRYGLQPSELRAVVEGRLPSGERASERGAALSVYRPACMRPQQPTRTSR